MCIPFKSEEKIWKNVLKSTNLYRKGHAFPGQSQYSRGSRFLIYNFLQFAIDGKNNSKTKVEKVFFFIFMSSYAEISFLK
jgi:hypothetical protein